MPAKITLAIRRAATYERYIKRNPLANKNKDNAYNRVYKPPTNTEEERGNKDNNKGEENKDNSNNNSISNSTNNSKDKARYKPSNSSLCYKDTLLYKR
ncbi:hypothetical protein P8C59_000971 [Phyllachora maydis]|uniref:Uncharacterized protein n=1 Tax=Phyllachora maydis TaxID=1825666 RepID=A0AAD9HYT1_9PEZI|nr:hypothetical protein P8C59_000971 [Phyllachora maydis]